MSSVVPSMLWLVTEVESMSIVCPPEARTDRKGKSGVGETGPSWRGSWLGVESV
jgi:hypothetical protein